MKRGFRAIALAAFGGSLCRIAQASSLSAMQLDQANELVQLVSDMSDGNYSQLPLIRDLADEFELVTVDKSSLPSIADGSLPPVDAVSLNAFQYVHGSSELLNAVTDTSAELDEPMEDLSVTLSHMRRRHRRRHRRHRRRGARRCVRRCFWRLGRRLCPLRCSWVVLARAANNVNSSPAPAPVMELSGNCPQCVQLYSSGVETTKSTQDALLKMIGDLSDTDSLEPKGYTLLKALVNAMRASVVGSVAGLDAIGGAMGESANSATELSSANAEMLAAAAALTEAMDGVASVDEEVSMDDADGEEEEETAFDGAEEKSKPGSDRRLRGSTRYV